MIKALLGSMRIPFLILTPICVLLGVATAYMQTNTLHWLDIILVLAGALAAHISVNTLNEYQDFCSGLDANTIKTPFSGGSGALLAQPEAANGVLALAAISLLITCLIGGYFIVQLGWAILLPGGLGVLLILTYTQWLNRQPFLCLIAPGLAFGPLMVLGSHWVLSGDYSLSAWLVALVPFCLVNNLLLLNQLPDIEADEQSGRRHFPIAYGISMSLCVYCLFLLAAAFVILIGVNYGLLPTVSLITLLAMLPGIIVFRGAYKYTPLDFDTRSSALSPYLGINVALTLSSLALLGVSLLIETV